MVDIRSSRRRILAVRQRIPARIRSQRCPGLGSRPAESSKLPARPHTLDNAFLLPPAPDPPLSIWRHLIHSNAESERKLRSSGSLNLAILAESTVCEPR